MKGEIPAETIEKDYEEYMNSVITPEDKAENSDAPADNADTTADASSEDDASSEEVASAEDNSDAKADENASTEEKSDDSDENKE